MLTAPLADLAGRMPDGAILDVGCGHGALVALLATGRPRDRRVTGVDPDPRKIAWARASVGRLPNVDLCLGTAERLVAERAGTFDAVAVADVMYLLPTGLWENFLRAALTLLRPGGRLFLKEAEGDRSWRHLKCVLQELAMVHLLRRTRSSGGLGLAPRAFTEALLRKVGFEEVRSTSMSAGYTTPHLLIEARRGS